MAFRRCSGSPSQRSLRSSSRPWSRRTDRRRYRTGSSVHGPRCLLNLNGPRTWEPAGTSDRRWRHEEARDLPCDGRHRGRGVRPDILGSVGTASVTVGRRTAGGRLRSITVPADTEPDLRPGRRRRARRACPGASADHPRGVPLGWPVPTRRTLRSPAGNAGIVIFDFANGRSVFVYVSAEVGGVVAASPPAPYPSGY